MKKEIVISDELYAARQGVIQMLGVAAFEQMTDAFRPILREVCQSGGFNTAQGIEYVLHHMDDYEIDPLEDAEIISAITLGNWLVTLFFDNEDLTGDYTEYQFSFELDGSIDITGGSGPLTGTWSTGGDNEQIELSLDFEDALLNTLDRNWDIISYSSEQLVLGKTLLWRL